MASYQKWIGMGNLGADPELRNTQSGTPVCNFSMATTESWKGNDGQTQSKTEWHKIVVWGLAGENAAKYLKKGSTALVEGQLETRKWQDKDGVDRYTTEIKASRVTFCDKKEQNQQQQQGGGLANHDFSQPSNTNPEDIPF